MTQTRVPLVSRLQRSCLIILISASSCVEFKWSSALCLPLYTTVGIASSPHVNSRSCDVASSRNSWSFMISLYIRWFNWMLSATHFRMTYLDGSWVSRSVGCLACTSYPGAALGTIVKIPGFTGPLYLTTSSSKSIGSFICSMVSLAGDGYILRKRCMMRLCHHHCQVMTM